jgi:hypothetical protein
VAWISLFFIPEAWINLLGRDLMPKLGIEIKVREKNFKMSLNLRTVQIKFSLKSGPGMGMGTATDSPNSY